MFEDKALADEAVHAVEKVVGGHGDDTVVGKSETVEVRKEV